MNFFLVTCVLVALASSVNAGLSKATLQEAEIVPPYESPYEGENPELDYGSDQFQRKGSSEIEVDDERDAAFDDLVCEESGRPREPPQGTIEQVFEKQKESIASDAKTGGIDVHSISLRVPYPFTYYTNKALWKPQLKCCPAKWKYGCRHINQRMPCFVNYYNNVREWCCPIWPGVYTARCLCDTCHIQTSSCIHRGRCLKRYTYKSFLAVCYRVGWFHLRYIRRPLPTSCYCSAGKYPYIAHEALSAQKCQN